MNGTQVWIHHKARQAQSQLQSARSQALSAGRIEDLVRVIGHTHVDHLVKSLVRHEKAQLKLAADRRAEELITALLEELSVSAAPADQRRLYDAYRLCCGHFPREANRLKRALDQQRAARHSASVVAP